MTTIALPSAESPSARDERLGAEITLLAGQINAGQYRLIKLIGTFDELNAWGGAGTVKSCAHWLNWKCGIALGAAREKVRVAHALDYLPKIDAAFARGEISYSKVRAMTRVATPETEDTLMNIAVHGTASHVETVVRKYRQARRLLEDEEEQSREESRQLHYYQDNDGMWVINAKLAPEAGSLVIKAIEALSDPALQARQAELQAQRREHRESDYTQEEGQDVSAETFFQSVQDEDPHHFTELVSHVRADSLTAMAEHFLATSRGEADFQGLKGTDRCQVVLHVDINTLRRQAQPGITPPHLDERPWVSAETARRLSCDASLMTVLEDEEGKVLNIGRRSRTVPAAIRRALDARDKTCRFPGCCERHHVEAHHIQHWADGGETRMDNLVKLCRFHHRQLHRGCYDIHVYYHQNDKAAMLVFTTPAGKRITSNFFPQFEHESSEEALAALSGAAPEVGPDTCIPHWQGETCDYGMVVETMLLREAAARTAETLGSRQAPV